MARSGLPRSLVPIECEEKTRFKHMEQSVISHYPQAASGGLPPALNTFALGKKPLSAEARQRVAMDFESMFLSQMLNTMFPGSDDFSDGAENVMGDMFGDETYRGWMIDEYAKQIAKAGGIGIAPIIERQLLQYQEVAAGGALPAQPQATPSAHAAPTPPLSDIFPTGVRL